MLPPSLRLLVRHQARSVPLQLRRRFTSTDTGQNEYEDFSKWAQKHQGRHRPKRSHQSQPRNAQGGELLTYKRIKKIKGPGSFDSTLGKPSNEMTREERIRMAVLATVGNKKAQALSASNWPGEGWKTDSWGPDGGSFVLNVGSTERTDHDETRAELKPPPSDDRNHIVAVQSSKSRSKKSKSRARGWKRICDGKCTRRVEGVLTPLGSAVLQGASLLVYLAFLRAYGFLQTWHL